MSINHEILQNLLPLNKMKKIIGFGICLATICSCQGTNGDNPPTQEELKTDLKKLMTPKKTQDVVLRPDSLEQDSIISSDSTLN